MSKRHKMETFTHGVNSTPPLLRLTKAMDIFLLSSPCNKDIVAVITSLIFNCRTHSLVQGSGCGGSILLGKDDSRFSEE